MGEFTAGWPGYLSRLAGLGLLAVVFADAMARSGTAPARMLGRRRPGGPGAALDRFGVALLLGMFGLGTAYLGLALTGLFHRPAVLGLPALLVAGSAAAWRMRSPLASAAREFAAATDPRWIAVIVAGFLPFTAMWVVPDSEQDSLVYHLGFPWQCLMAGKALLSHVSLSFHVGLPVDLVYALPMAAGDERFCKWIVMTWFAGAAAVFAAAGLRRNAPRALPLFVLLAVASPNLHPLMTNTKNDLAAASLFLAGAWRQLGGRWSSGALLIGCATAAKFVIWPFAALWTIAILPPRDIRWRCGGLLLLASLPWWGKAWLAVGNPLVPFATDRIPTLGWSDVNREVFTAGQRQLALPEALSWKTLPGGFWSQLRKLYLPLALLLPGALLLGPRLRLVAGVSVAGALLTLGIGRLSRYMVPPLGLLASVAALGLARPAGPVADRARGLLLAFALWYAWVPQVRHPVARFAFLPPAQAYREGFTTFAEALDLLAGRSPNRYFQIGEVRTHRIPGRVCYDATSGETPFPWQVARESADPGRMAVRWKQMGARWLLYNYVTVEWQAITHWRFEWTREALRRHVEFCRRYLVMTGRTETSDYLNGGFYVFEIRRTPLATPPKTIWFAPGTENLYGRGILLHNSGRQQEALDHYRAVREVMPEVGTAWNMVGHELAVMNQPGPAFEALHPFASQGMFDAMNLGEYGASAMRSGRLAIAATVLEDCMRRYPGHRNVIRVNLAALQGAKSVEALRARDPAEAVRLLDRGEAILAEVPKGPNPKEGNETARRQTLAMMWSIRGEMAFAESQHVVALRYLRQALEIAPESPGATRWRQLIAALEPRPFGGP